jgi:hypothetical protein
VWRRGGRTALWFMGTLKQLFCWLGSFPRLRMAFRLCQGFRLRRAYGGQDGGQDGGQALGGYGHGD